VWRRLKKTENELNRLVRKYNNLVARINRKVNQLNSTASPNMVMGITRTTKRGDIITGLEINIFAFSDWEHLQSVIAHEFGHALGLPHVPSDRRAIMFPYHNEVTQNRATSSDLTLFGAKCGI